ncbi:hypothetical protein HCU40_10815 [Pseudanabaena biceps]|nr:hypothetical protein [Pseudanabaena biceps]
MKNIFIATVLTISSFVISGLAIANPVNAQPQIMAALYPNSTAPQVEITNQNAEINRNQIIVAVNATPEMIAITTDLVSGYSYDRIVTMSKADSIGCLVNGNGSVNGSVMCGFIDHD